MANRRFFLILIILSVCAIACSLNSDQGLTQKSNSLPIEQKSVDIEDIRIAIIEKNYSRLEKLLEAKPNLDVRDEKENSLLQETLNFDLKSAEMLLQAGANPDFESLEIGCGASERCLKRPLYIAFKRNDVAKLKLLLKHKADPNKDSLLAWAVSRNQIDIVSLLISHKADVNIKNSNGQSAFQLAKTSGNKSIIKLLKESGAK